MRIFFLGGWIWWNCDYQPNHDTRTFILTLELFWSQIREFIDTIHCSTTVFRFIIIQSPLTLQTLLHSHIMRNDPDDIYLKSHA